MKPTYSAVRPTCCSTRGFIRLEYFTVWPTYSMRGFTKAGVLHCKAYIFYERIY